MKQMENELNEYKKQVESLREGTATTTKVVPVKSKQSIPFPFIIFIALLVAAIAYFVKS